MTYQRCCDLIGWLLITWSLFVSSDDTCRPRRCQLFFPPCPPGGRSCLGGDSTGDCVLGGGRGGRGRGRGRATIVQVEARLNGRLLVNGGRYCNEESIAYDKQH